NAYLNLSALNLTNNALTVTGTSLAAPVIDLRIQDGQQRTTANGPLTEQASSYNFGGVSAGTELDADAGGSTAVNLSFTSPGGVPVGSVTSRLGAVRLTAAGAIRAARPGGAPDVIANNVTLIAGSTIGAGNPLLLDSAHRASGTVTATAGGMIALNEVAGNLSLNQVRSTGGNVFLTAAGQILDGRPGTGAPPNNVETTTGLADLSAGLGIGTAPHNLVTSVADLEASAGTGALYINNNSPSPLLIGGGGPVV